jgi:hypothetical protein
MKGTKISNNYYRISTLTLLGCQKATLDDLDLWHQRFGHINFRDLSKNSKKKVVQGLPNMQIIKTIVCGACHKGKQTKAQHKKIANILTSRPLELLHMDLMVQLKLRVLVEISISWSL